MRVISGSLKNRPLKSPSTSVTHPMGDREKNALFNSLTPYAPFKTVLDAFAGSGALGIEALSRGFTDFVVFCDNDATSVKTIKENLGSLKLEQKSKIIKTSVENLLKSPETLVFDLIVADPPYDHFNPETITNLTNLLAKNAIFALSHPSSFDPETLVENYTSAHPGEKLSLLTTKQHAAANLSIFQKICYN